MSKKHFLISAIIGSIVFLVLVIFTSIRPRSVGQMGVLYGLNLFIFWLLAILAIWKNKLKVIYFLIFPYIASFLSGLITSQIISPIFFDRKPYFKIDFLVVYLFFPYGHGIWIMSLIMIAVAVILKITAKSETA